jgi:hypothetical protein
MREIIINWRCNIIRLPFFQDWPPHGNSSQPRIPVDNSPSIQRLLDSPASGRHGVIGKRLKTLFQKVRVLEQVGWAEETVLPDHAPR